MSKEKWYNLSVEEVIKAFKTRTEGLSSDEAEKRLKEYGPNELVEKERTPKWKMLLEQFNNVLIIILLVAVVLSGVLGEVADAIVILIVVVFASVFGFVQEYKAERAIEALKKMASPTADVLRDGKRIEISARESVPGDIIMIGAGDKIPADARMVSCVNLKIDEAALTGESVAVEKTNKVGTLHAMSLQSEISIGDRKNMIFMGTVAVYGKGTAVVTATGMGTEFGKIATMLQEVKKEKTPLQVGLDHVGKVITVVALVLCFILAGLGVMRGHKILEMLIWGVSLAVAAVPEALPAVVTVCLAIGVQRMVKRNALVRRLPAVETLGCTTFICSDKTGTLTQDKMTIRQIYTDGKLVEISGVGYEPKGKFSIGGQVIEKITEHRDLKLLLEAGSLCNDAELELSEGKWRIKGDPTEGAIIVAGAKGGINRVELVKLYPRVGEVPFSSESKKMVTFHSSNSEVVAYSKGAPEIILNTCNYFMSHRVGADASTYPINPEEVGERVLSAEDKERMIEVARGMASNALRVLGIAYKKMRSLPGDLEKETSKGMVFIGLVGMIDPPREEVKDAIKLCDDAKVKSVMITGDHKLTAMAIGKELGLLKSGMAVSGEELDKLSEEEFDKVVDKIEVYARVSPSHKLRVVETLTRRGEVVAMTGDGVNDAPALKKADIGIAMGLTGTDVTRESADMILTDDNFASIVAAVEEGRCIFSNIKKFLVYILSCNVGEVLVMAIAILFGTFLGIPAGFLPLIAIQILFVNLVTDSLPAVALALEPMEKGVMGQKPRARKESIFTKSVIWYIVVVGIWKAMVTLAAFIWAIRRGESMIEAQCLCFATLIFAQYFNAINCRSLERSVFSIGFFKNGWLWGALGITGAMTVIVIYLPWLQEVFHTYSLTLKDWLVSIILSGSVFVMVEVWKGLRSLRVKNKQLRVSN